MFLATTALEEFWDKKQKLLFLGEWCKLYDRRHVWSALEHEQLPFVWRSRGRVLDALSYCNRVYEGVLAALTSNLNQYHEVEKSKEYWRLILGNWLIHFIHQSYDKLCCLEAAVEAHRRLQTRVPEVSHFYVPVDFLDYLRCQFHDPYNLQIYSQLISDMKIEAEPATMRAPLTQKLNYVCNRGGRYGIRSRLARYTQRWQEQTKRDPVTLVEPGFNEDPAGHKKALLDAAGEVCTIETLAYNISIEFKIDWTIRNLPLDITPRDEFERHLQRMTLANLPALFLEGYSGFRRKVLSLPIEHSGTFFTSTALAANYIFKFFVAEYRDEITLLSAQHGGNYGILRGMLAEQYDRSLSDRFFTWGWHDDDTTEPLPHPKLQTGAFRNRRDGRALLVQTLHPRYVYRLGVHMMATDVLERYFEPTMTFLRLLSSKIDLVVRPYDYEFLWFERERLRDRGLNPLFEEADEISFKESMAKSRICVFDHLETTYLEALAANQPTLIFIDPELYVLRESARPFFEELQAVGILHYSPDSAARHLNTVYDDVESWWRSDSVQVASQAFSDRYALSDPNWPSAWAHMFSRFIETECPLSHSPAY